MDVHGTISNRSKRILAKRFNLCAISAPTIHDDYENTGYSRPNYLFFLIFNGHPFSLHARPA
jgi:hypothetical protein